MASIIFLILAIILCSRTSGATARGMVFEADSAMEKYEQWMAQFHRVYSDQSEKTTRFEIFKKNLDFVENFNKNKNKTYKLAVNEFSDLTEEEFRARYMGLDVPEGVTELDSNKAVSFKYENVSKDEIGESLDWRQEGAVTPVKHQGRCGSCWAFSAVAAVEGIIKIRQGELIDLSEQQLVDCDRVQNQGCSGGLPTKAYDYISNQGITSEANYPYQARESGTCALRTRSTVTISGYEMVPTQDEDALLKAVSQQPVSVGINSYGYEFMNYKGGIFAEQCATDLNHAVTIVGYGTSEEGTNYWLIKNSWGETWGENGYMRMRRDVESPQGMCGIAIHASYPVA